MGFKVWNVNINQFVNPEDFFLSNDGRLFFNNGGKIELAKIQFKAIFISVST